jgi:hypothetical protein
VANLHGEGEHEFEADVSIFFFLLFVTGVPVIRKNYTLCIKENRRVGRKGSFLYLLIFRGDQFLVFIESSSDFHVHTQKKTIFTRTVTHTVHRNHHSGPP